MLTRQLNGRFLLRTATINVLLSYPEPSHKYLRVKIMRLQQTARQRPRKLGSDWLAIGLADELEFPDPRGFCRKSARRLSRAFKRPQGVKTNRRLQPLSRRSKISQASAVDLKTISRALVSRKTWQPLKRVQCCAVPLHRYIPFESGQSAHTVECV